MATTPTQMRLTEADLKHLDRIKHDEDLSDRTNTVRFLMGYYDRVEADLRFADLEHKRRFRKNSSVAT